MNLDSKQQNTTTDNSIRFHESGAMLKIYMLKGSGAYVLLLKSAPIRTMDGEFWGCQTVAIQTNNAPPLLMAFHDLPGGKTNQFDCKAFRKLYFPREGPGADPMQMDTARWNIESGAEAAVRETIEETHGVIRPEAPFSEWLVDGGYTQNVSGLKSETAVVMSFTKVSSLKQLFFLRMQFLQENMGAFQEYNQWAAKNPLTRANQSQHWDRRPEFCDMTFVTWATFRDGLQQAALQLKRYRQDKKTQGKGIICMLTDYMDRPIPVMLRSWPVIILSGIEDKLAHRIYKEKQHQ